MRALSFSGCIYSTRTSPTNLHSPSWIAIRGRPYDGEIAFADSEIGRLLARLRSLGLAERTLVVFAADHGESLGEHGYTGHGMRLYEPAVRVPLIASFPGRLRQGRRVKELVRLVDLMPTVLSLLQIDVDRPFDGVDLTDRIEGRGGEEPLVRLCRNTLPDAAFRPR